MYQKSRKVPNEDLGSTPRKSFSPVSQSYEREWPTCHAALVAMLDRAYRQHTTPHTTGTKDSELITNHLEFNTSTPVKLFKTGRCRE